MSNIAFVAVVFLALAIQGCGGSDSSSPTMSSDLESPTPVVQSDTETTNLLEVGRIETEVLTRGLGFYDISPRDRIGNELDLKSERGLFLSPQLLLSFFAEMEDISNLAYVQIKQLDSGVYWSLYDSSSPEMLEKSCYNATAKMFQCFYLFNDAETDRLPLDNWEFLAASLDDEITSKPFKIRNPQGLPATPLETLIAPVVFEDPSRAKDIDDITNPNTSIESVAAIPEDPLFSALDDFFDNRAFYLTPGTDMFRLEFEITDPLTHAYTVVFYDEAGETLLGTLDLSANTVNMPDPTVGQKIALDIDPGRDIFLNFYPNSDRRFRVCDIRNAHVVFYNAPDLSTISSRLEYYSSYTTVSANFTLSNPEDCVN
jgi:hypothetical protein